MAPALTLASNKVTQVHTAAHHATALTPITVARGTTTAVDLTHTTATTRVGPIRTGAMARPGDITRTHTMAVTRTATTTSTTRTTCQRTVMTDQ